MSWTPSRGVPTPLMAVRSPEADEPAVNRLDGKVPKDGAPGPYVQPRGRHVMPAQSACAHIQSVVSVKTPLRHECAECVATGARWVHLRTCQTCGVTLCCDSSPNRHATKHAHASGHPVIASAEPGERWMYCYPDDAFVEY